MLLHTVLGAGIDAQNFNWLEAPDQQLLDTAVQQLRYLGALEPAGQGLQLTPFGRLVIGLQASRLLFVCHVMPCPAMPPALCKLAMPLRHWGSMHWLDPALPNNSNRLHILLHPQLPKLLLRQLQLQQCVTSPTWGSPPPCLLPALPFYNCHNYYGLIQKVIALFGGLSTKHQGT